MHQNYNMESRVSFSDTNVMQSSRQEDFQVEYIKQQIHEGNQSTLECLERCRKHVASFSAKFKELSPHVNSQGEILKNSDAHLDEAGFQTQLARGKIEKLQRLIGNARPSFLKKRNNDCNNDGESEPRDFHATSLDDPTTNNICHSWSPTYAETLKYQFEVTNEGMEMESEINFQM